jgi:hypothetical protein
LHTRKRLALYTLYILILALVTCCGIRVCFAQDANQQAAATPENNANALCYTCHLGLKDEEITAKHIAKSISCAICHGPSVEHMHDEMQVTKPDRLYGRAEIDPMCSACHAAHKDPNKVEVFRSQWLGKTRPNGRVITEKSICTDCHGSHNFISEQIASPASATAEKWESLFNHENLAGWHSSDETSWSIKTGRIIGKPADANTANLWSKEEFADYKLSVTFKADPSSRAWISLRSADNKDQLHLELFDRPQQGIFSPSLSIDGKAIILANLNKDLIDKLGWNTIIAELKADTCRLTLNGEPVGSVRIKPPAKSPIGFHIEKSAGNSSASVSISEIHIQRL